MRFTLPPLPYAYEALEPYFDKETMNIHHTKHHQTYINNANSVLKGCLDPSFFFVEDLIKKLDAFPEDQKTMLRNNAGGHLNHSFFWRGLQKGTTLQGKLKSAIIHNFGSIAAFQEVFEQTALARFGSGWVWLVKKDKKLVVVSTSNQDNPLMGKLIAGVSGYPILGLDVWEHAYYLKYQNRRLDYVKAFWSIVNWDEAGMRFDSH